MPACEIGAGVDYSGSSPKVRLCGKPASLYYVLEMPFQVALCADHAASRPEGTTFTTRKQREKAVEALKPER